MDQILKGKNLQLGGGGGGVRWGRDFFHSVVDRNWKGRQNENGRVATLNMFIYTM